MARVRIKVTVDGREMLLLTDTEDDFGLDEGEWEHEMNRSEKKAQVEDWVADHLEISF